MCGNTGVRSREKGKKHFYEQSGAICCRSLYCFPLVGPAGGSRVPVQPAGVKCSVLQFWGDGGEKVS